MTSPYGPFGSNDPQPWGRPSAGTAVPAPQWGSVPPPQWGPAPAPQWGPASESQPTQAPGQPDRRRLRPGGPGRLALVIGGPVVALAALVAVLGLTWPGFLNEKVFDDGALQVGVTGVLRDSYQLDVTGVDCPPEQPVRVDERFPCSVVVDGEQRTVTVVVTSGDGRFEVGRPQ
ncbi:DUF4333 domain-containing protein [Micromonospora sp. NPDC004704]